MDGMSKTQVTGHRLLSVLPILKQPQTFTNTNLETNHCLSVVFRPKVSTRKGLGLFQYSVLVKQ